MKTATIPKELYKGAGFAVAGIVNGEVVALQSVEGPFDSSIHGAYENVTTNGQGVVALGIAGNFEFNYMFSKAESKRAIHQYRRENNVPKDQKAFRL